MSGLTPLSPASSDPVLCALLAQPMSPDTLATALSMDARELLRTVAALEAEGRVARYPDGRYGPCAPR